MLARREVPGAHKMADAELRITEISLWGALAWHSEKHAAVSGPPLMKEFYAMANGKGVDKIKDLRKSLVGIIYWDRRLFEVRPDMDIPSLGGRVYPKNYCELDAVRRSYENAHIHGRRKAAIGQ